MGMKRGFEILKGRIELEAEELFTGGEVEVASDAEGDVDVQIGPPPASEGIANEWYGKG